MIKKRHHFSSEFYLRGFIDPHNPPYIWIYEKGNPNIRNRTAENIGVQRYYYAFTTPEGTRDSNSFEDMFAMLEGYAAPIFQKIKELCVLDDRERSDFALFLAYFITRVPNFRENVQKVTGDLAKKISMEIASDAVEFESTIRKYEQDTGEKIDMPFAELQIFIREGRYNIHIKPEFSLTAIPIADDLAPVLFQMKWEFFVARDSERFVTSDNPVSINGRGLVDHDVEITFPVSKDIGFLGTWANVREGYIDASNKAVKELNRRTVISASRNVYSSRKTEQLNQLVQKHKNSAPKWEIA